MCLYDKSNLESSKPAEILKKVYQDEIAPYCKIYAFIAKRLDSYIEKLNKYRQSEGLEE